MTEEDVDIINQRAKKRPPGIRPRTIVGQRPPVHGKGFQDLHPGIGNDSCANVILLSPEQRQDRTLAQNPEAGEHPALLQIDLAIAGHSRRIGRNQLQTHQTSGKVNMSHRIRNNIGHHHELPVNIAGPPRVDPAVTFYSGFWKLFSSLCSLA